MTDQPNELSPNKLALLKIRELKQQLAEAEKGGGEPIAIVSMACRFPRRSRTPEEFWQCLIDQTDEVSEIPDDRWDLDAFYDEDPEVPGKMYARQGVFLDNLDLMDPEFFGISPREATWVDPQQRLLMEVGWEALERAGWQPEKIGESTGMFAGWMHNDYQNEASDSFSEPESVHCNRCGWQFLEWTTGLLPGFARPEPGGRHRLLFVAGRVALGMSKPAAWRLRSSPGRRRQHNRLADDQHSHLQTEGTLTKRPLTARSTRRPTVTSAAKAAESSR